jgi:hypothetical protein
MKTDELIAALAAGVEPVDRRAPERRLLLAAGGGLLLGALLMLALLGLNPALAHDAGLPMFWVKLGFVAGATVAGFFATTRLARPGAALAPAAVLVGAPFASMWLLALLALGATAPEQRVPAIMGSTWQACPINIAMLSIPTLAVALWAMRGLAPTRLRLAGAGAGLLAGALGALAYALHCPEMAAPFIGIWYALGMLVPVVAGAALGPRLLRW